MVGLSLFRSLFSFDDIDQCAWLLARFSKPEGHLWIRKQFIIHIESVNNQLPFFFSPGNTVAEVGYFASLHDHFWILLGDAKRLTS